MKGYHENAAELLQRIAKVNRKEPLNLSHRHLKEFCDFWTRNYRNLELCCLQNNSNSRNYLLESERLHCYSCRKQLVIINILW